MSRQRHAAAHALARLQDLHSDCSSDEDTDSETEDMANSVKSLEWSSLTHHHRTSGTMNQIHQHRQHNPIKVHRQHNPIKALKQHNPTMVWHMEVLLKAAIGTRWQKIAVLRAS